jgi:hypothetical protein
MAAGASRPLPLREEALNRGGGLEGRPVAELFESQVARPTGRAIATYCSVIFSAFARC